VIDRGPYDSSVRSLPKFICTVVGSSIRIGRMRYGNYAIYLLSVWAFYGLILLTFTQMDLACIDPVIVIVVVIAVVGIAIVVFL
jgi:hypothetical protein